MKKHWLISAALLTLATNGAWAQSEAPTPTSAPVVTAPVPATSSAPASSDAGGKHHHARTLEEARKYAHAKADKLDKMTDAEYQAQQDKRHAAHEKWKSMTPDERAAAKKAKHDKWLAKKQGAASTSAPAASAPASAPAAAPASAQ